MPEADSLKKIQHYAQQIRENGERFESEPPANLDPALLQQIRTVARLARETEEQAGSPVKIGVVGEFSAGKTLLLGGLIGYADALPVTELPTTGNVTALHFIPV